VQIISFNPESRHSISQFEEALSDAVDPEPGRSNTFNTANYPRRPANPSGRPPISFARFVDGISDGYRDVELFRLACFLRRRGYPRETVLDVVLDAASRCRPPFPPRLAEIKINSAWRYTSQ
jgi:hypothetical protein